MKKIPTALSIIAILIGSVVFLNIGGRALIFASRDSELSLPGNTPRGNAEIPDSMRLQIPTLGLDADVEYVSVNGKGDMAAPSRYERAAWYRHGAVPGERGSAVMAGHLDNGLGLSGVFRQLEEIRVGDDVYVVKDGERLHFVVSEIKTYPYKEVPAEELFLKDDAARLNLVTCVGAWLNRDKTYDKRLIVYTRLVND